MAVPGVFGRDRIIAADGGSQVSLRRARWLPWLVAVCAMALFARLGVWQLERAGEKRAMLADAARALADRRPQPLQVLNDRDRAGAYDWVVLRGRFAEAPAVLLDNQQRGGKVGVRAYRVFLPKDGLLNESPAVLVDLGWSPLPSDRTLPAVPRDDTRTTLTGLLMPPPGRGLDLGPPAEQPGGQWLTTAIDTSVLRDTLRLRDLAPRVLRPSPEPGFGFERDFDILPNTLPPERHVGYAVQWFGLSATVLIVALLLERRRRAGLRASTLADANTDTIDA
ncbi:MAG: SURF1 family protein [Xanthomonadaceae bacterium]|nr:SURF1 family protein [Xanthomonadaceae bacterium]